MGFAAFAPRRSPITKVLCPTFFQESWGFEKNIKPFFFEKKKQETSKIRVDTSVQGRQAESIVIARRAS
ncbi:MAG: hypothetical protein Q4B50_02710 [Bacillota bacterium]|nr:hypothetical protein [Bacillota bacterium]